MSLTLTWQLHRIWRYSPTESISVTKTTIVSWFLLGVYKTQERLFKMKKTFSPNCLLCESPSKSPIIEDRKHLALECEAYDEMRQQYLDKFNLICPTLHKYKDVTDGFLMILLDPLSNEVPVDIREGWSNMTDAYKLSRNFFHALHKKRTKLLEKLI